MVKSWTILGADRMDESLKAQLQATLEMIPTQLHRSPVS